MPRPKISEYCVTPSCDLKSYGKGLCISHYHKKYREENKEKFHEYRNDPTKKERANFLRRQVKYLRPDVSKRRNRTDSSRYKSGKTGAKDRGYVWEITKEQWKSLVISNSCYYCNNSLPETGCGLDRKDNSIGYTLLNVVPCCRSCNRTKGDDISHNEMIEIAILLKKLRNEK